MDALFKLSDFPQQPIPIYDFYLSRKGHLKLDLHYCYVRSCNTEKSGLIFRIHTGKRIILKSSDQLGRYLNNHVYTLDYNPEQVKRLIKEHYTKKVNILTAELENASRTLKSLKF